MHSDLPNKLAKLAKSNKKLLESLSSHLIFEQTDYQDQKHSYNNIKIKELIERSGRSADYNEQLKKTIQYKQEEMEQATEELLIKTNKIENLKRELRKSYHQKEDKEHFQEKKIQQQNDILARKLKKLELQIQRVDSQQQTQDQRYSEHQASVDKHNLEFDHKAQALEREIETLAAKLRHLETFYGEKRREFDRFKGEVGVEVGRSPKRDKRQRIEDLRKCLDYEFEGEEDSRW